MDAKCVQAVIAKRRKGKKDVAHATLPSHPPYPCPKCPERNPRRKFHSSSAYKTHKGNKSLRRKKQAVVRKKT